MSIKVDPHTTGPADDGVWFIAPPRSTPHGYGPHFLVCTGREKEGKGYAFFFHDKHTCRPHSKDARVFADEQAEKCYLWLVETLTSCAGKPPEEWPDPPVSFTFFSTEDRCIGRSFCRDGAGDPEQNSELLQAIQNISYMLERVWPEWAPPEGEG